MSSNESASRPGGRTALNSQRIFAATMSLLGEGGYPAATFQAVADRAGVARATLYRRWPTPAELVGDAIAASAAERIVIPDTGSLGEDLAATLRQIAGFLSAPVGRAALLAMLALQPGNSSAEINPAWATRWAEVLPLFERAQMRGELPASADFEAIFASVAGAVYYRALVMGGTADDGWIERVIAETIKT
jgi:AcrR family transcriptional regulator